MSGREYSVLLALGAIWGASFMFIKVGGAEIQPFALVEMRLGLAALTMFMFVGWRRGVLSSLVANWKPLVVMGLINCALPYTLITWGESYISSGLAAIFNACTPLWGAVLGLTWASAEKLSPTRLAGLLLGLGGVALVVSSNLAGGEEGVMFLLGQGAVLLAALSYAVSGVYGRTVLKAVPGRVAAMGQLVWGAVLMLPLAVFEVPRSVPSWQALGAVTTLAVLGTAVASLIYYWLLARVGSTGTLLVTYLLPCFALVWGALLLHEGVSLPAVAGLALVLAGVGITSGGGASLIARLTGRTDKQPAQ